MILVAAFPWLACGRRLQPQWPCHESVNLSQMTPKMKICLTHGRDEQASTDYDVELSFSQEVAGQRVEESRRFLERIHWFLQREGLDEAIPA